MNKKQIVSRFQRLSNEMKACAEIMRDQAVVEEWRINAAQIKKSAFEVDTMLYRWTYEPPKATLFYRLAHLFRVVA